ncbi:MAG: multidrug effflux MFS transporter [Sphingobium sp.]
MTAQQAPAPHKAGRDIGFIEFVILCAAMMALNALSIDPMLPALPDIVRDLHVAHPNDRQLVITVYFLGMGAGAMLFGVLADRFGRKPVLVGAMGFFVISTLACAAAQSFPMLLVARACAGFVAAAGRVITVSIVRDRFQGDAMARVMSLIFAIFIIVPVVAPAFGQAILWIAPWRWIFWVLGAIIALVMGWIMLRLPETLPRQNRLAINLREIGRTVTRVTTNRQAIGYMLAAGILSSCLVSFILSIQQIMFDRFDVPDLFPLIFAGIAIGMGAGSLVNSRLVARFGARRMSQSALFALIALSLLRLGLLLAGLETLTNFILLQAATMVTISFTISNFSAISMEPFAKGAGFASSFQTFLTTVISAILGGLVGGAFDGTTMPLILGLLGFGLSGLLVILWTERGKLFTRPHRDLLRVPDIEPLP